uniref:Reverse transcriptase Ty1/copia-type domain-containing protein n=1 Tax=Cajanus cajan TaxID=3821 RepID=A0A151RFG9_CAJCA|nr:hypothetical protein KK1_037484 [Cajanus cajan]
MKDLGHLTYFLGLKVHFQQKDIFVSQNKYTQDLIQLACLTNATVVDTPVEVNVKLRWDEGELLPDPTLYKNLVGSLTYLTITRLDIFFDVHTVSKFMQNLRHLHFSTIQCIIKYLLATPRRGLFFPTTSLGIKLKAYNDGDWTGCSDTRKSTTC